MSSLARSPNEQPSVFPPVHAAQQFRQPDRQKAALFAARLRPTLGVMRTYNCPACHRSTLSYWRVQFLGPLRSLKCNACGSRVSVPWLLSSLFGLLATVAAWFGGLSAIVLFGSYSFVSELTLAVAVVVGAVVVTAPILWLYGRVLYLVVK